MPRINFEDKLFVDPRYKKLCQLLGEVQANGWLVILWRLAQEYYRKNILEVPVKVYEFALFPKELIECEFVEKKEDSYYIKGSKRNFEWMKKRKEAGSKGGRTTAKLLRNKDGKFAVKSNINRRHPQNTVTAPQINQANPSCSLVETKQMPSTTSSCSLAKTKQNQASFSSSFSFSSRKERIHTVVLSTVNGLLDNFSNRYKEKFGTKYMPNFGKDKKLLNTLLKEFSPQELDQLMILFFNSEDKFIKITDYSVGVFYSQINKLNTGPKMLKWDEI